MTMKMGYSILHDLFAAKEDENLEFKEKKHRFDFEELVKYACAIANCGGGHIVYGITDKRPRQVVGTTAIEQPERTRRGLMDRIGLPFDFQLFEEDGNAPDEIGCNASSTTGIYRAPPHMRRSLIFIFDIHSQYVPNKPQKHPASPVFCRY